MLLLGLAIDEYSIEVGDKEPANKRTHHLVHDSHKCAWRIS